jgi:hypothetical protein
MTTTKQWRQNRDEEGNNVVDEEDDVDDQGENGSDDTDGGSHAREGAPFFHSYFSFVVIFVSM